MSFHDGIQIQLPSFYHSGVSNSCEDGKIQSCAWRLHFKIVILKINKEAIFSVVMTSYLFL
jgi:hypothetical protein